MSSTDELYGLIILVGSFECVQLGIGAVVSAVEGASQKPQPLPPPPVVSASTSAHGNSSSLRVAPTIPPPPPPASPPLPANPAPPCAWPLRQHKKCFRARCRLPAESHEPYSAQLMRCLDTAPRLLAAVPAFTSDFVFVVCRSPQSAEPSTSTFLCSLCVPNDCYASGYVRGRDGSMRTALEQAAGTRITWGHPSLADLLMLWKTVRAEGTLEAIDTVVEGITHLVEARPDASVEQLAEHLERFKRQRARQEQRPMLWSMLSRGRYSAVLDSLLAGDAPQPQPQQQPQPPAPPQKGRDHQPQREEAQAERRRSSSSSEQCEERSEPCPNYTCGFGCKDRHCRLSHYERPYHSWLAARLRSSSDSMSELSVFKSTFKAVLSDNSGLPAQPLLVSLPVPAMVLHHRYLHPRGPLMYELQRRTNLFVSTPHNDDILVNAPWGTLRSRGNTRQVDCMIEWCCWIMDFLRQAGYGPTFMLDRQIEQARRLERHLDKWLEHRAEYVAAHGEALYAFIGRGLEGQVRLSFTLSEEESVASAPRDATMTDTTSEEKAPSSASSALPSTLSPNSASSSSSSRSSDSSNNSDSSGGGSSDSFSSATSSPPSDSTTSPRSHPSLSLTSPPVIDTTQLLHDMHTTGQRLAYTSFVQHPPYSAARQPFIRILPGQTFANWPIRAVLRGEFLSTLDDEALPLSAFEERWGVEVFMPPAEDGAGGGGGSGKEWCNVCVRMMKGSGDETEESGCSGGGVKAAMECVMLAVMKRAERVEQLTSAR